MVKYDYGKLDSTVPTKRTELAISARCRRLQHPTSPLTSSRGGRLPSTALQARNRPPRMQMVESRRQQLPEGSITGEAPSRPFLAGTDSFCGRRRAVGDTYY